MKKEFFFFNLNTLNSFFLKKVTLKFLPIKYLIRSLDFKNSALALIDTFSFFFLLKIYKKKSFKLSLKLNKKPLLLKKINNPSYTILKKKKIGNFLFLDKVFSSSSNKLQISFNFFKQFSFLKKKIFFFSFLSHLKCINTFKNSITFFKKKSLKKGLLKYYFNGVLVIKHGKFFKKKLIKNKINFNLSQPLLISNNSTLVLTNVPSYILTTQKLYYLTRMFSNVKIYNKKAFEIKLFALRKRIYKKDFRYTISLNTKVKKYHFKTGKKY